MLSVQKRNITQQKGFTLIELMIVVAIVAILAIIAVPMYQNYVARTQMTEALSLADSLKIQVAETYAQDGALTNADSSTNGIPTAANVTGTYVQTVAVADGVITATMKTTGVSAGVSGKTLTITPTPNADQPLKWACTSNALAQHIPKPCTTTVAP